MRLIADESCDFAIVRGLREAQHDVLSVMENAAGSSDEQVIEFARNERRLLITEDKDFGQLVRAAAKENSGVVLVRYPAMSRSRLVPSILELLSQQGESLYDSFVVMEPGRIRLGRAVG
jgi:predicted nuclease of predicted toxin-antitoxin system